MDRNVSKLREVVDELSRRYDNVVRSFLVQFLWDLPNLSGYIESRSLEEIAGDYFCQPDHNRNGQQQKTLSRLATVFEADPSARRVSRFFNAITTSDDEHVSAFVDELSLPELYLDFFDDDEIAEHVEFAKRLTDHVPAISVIRKSRRPHSAFEAVVVGLNGSGVGLEVWKSLTYLGNGIRIDNTVALTRLKDDIYVWWSGLNPSDSDEVLSFQLDEVDKLFQQTLLVLLSPHFRLERSTKHAVSRHFAIQRIEQQPSPRITVQDLDDGSVLLARRIADHATARRVVAQIYGLTEKDDQALSSASRKEARGTSTCRTVQVQDALPDDEKSKMICLDLDLADDSKSAASMEAGRMPSTEARESSSQPNDRSIETVQNRSQVSIKKTFHPEFHNAFADPTRIRIVAYLAREKEARTVSQVQKAAKLNKQAASHHLGILRGAGIVASEKRGRQVYCWLKGDVSKRLYACARAVDMS